MNGPGTSGLPFFIRMYRARMVKIVLPLKVKRMVEKQTRHGGSLVVQPTTSHIALKILG